MMGGQRDHDVAARLHSIWRRSACAESGTRSRALVDLADGLRPTIQRCLRASIVAKRDLVPNGFRPAIALLPIAMPRRKRKASRTLLDDGAFGEKVPVAHRTEGATESAPSRLGYSDGTSGSGTTVAGVATAGRTPRRPLRDREDGTRFRHRLPSSVSA